MAHSLEVRVPLMDHELVEWLADAACRLKLQGGEGKSFSREALEPLLPHDVLYRTKMGFSVPLAALAARPARSSACVRSVLEPAHQLIRAISMRRSARILVEAAPRRPSTTTATSSLDC